MIAEFLEQGADKMIAGAYGISTSTLWRWRRQNLLRIHIDPDGVITSVEVSWDIIERLLHRREQQDRMMRQPPTSEGG